MNAAVADTSSSERSRARFLRSDGMQRWLRLPDVAEQAGPRLLKLLDPALAMDGNLSREWLGRAVQNRVLCHPSRPEVLEATRDDSGVFLVSEYGEGVVLAELIERGPLTPALAVHVCSMLLTALEQAQSCDSALTHLDLDPAGILVRRDGRLLLPEFGLWGVLSPRESARRRFDAGRVAYASPELVQARPADTRSDVFSIGTLLYELLSGERAFAGGTSLAVAMAIDGGMRKPLTVAESLREVVDVMLESEVEARFQTPAAARQALLSVVPCDQGAAQRELAQRVATHGEAVAGQEPRTRIGLGLTALVRAAVPSAREPASIRVVQPKAAAFAENPFVRSAPAPEPHTGPAPPPLFLSPAEQPAPPAASRAPRAPHDDVVHDGRTAFLRVDGRGTREHKLEPAREIVRTPKRVSALDVKREHKLETALRTVLPRAWLKDVTEPPAPRSPQGKWRDPSATLFQARRPALSMPIVKFASWPCSWWIATALLLGLPTLAAMYLVGRLWF